MQDSLISRKAVLELIWELIEISEYDSDKILMTKDEVENLPAAYDVDKVVEQLESKIEITWSHDYLGGRKDAFNEAIEIVKGGGVDE